MSSLLYTYKIKFSRRVNLGGLRTVSSVNPYLSQFIGDHYRIVEVNRLLAGINNIIANNDLIGGGFPTQSLLIAIINKAVVKIYSDMDDYEVDNNITATFTLPTEDFRSILLAWKEYLES